METLARFHIMGIAALNLPNCAAPLLTQIYEIQTPDVAEALCGMGVDHVGSVVLTPEDWCRPVIRETVRTVQRCGKKSSLILLFNDAPTVYRSLDYYRPDLVHFCELLTLDDAGIERCRGFVDLQRAMRRRYPGIAIMRSIPIGRAGDNNAAALALAELFEPVSDFFLTDTLLTSGAIQTPQPVDGFVGITGQTCHWETARQLVAASRLPVILAGGLSPENVSAAVRAVRPAGVDSCTRTNRLDAQGRPVRFQKDLERVRLFVENASRAACECFDNNGESGASRRHFL